MIGTTGLIMQLSAITLFQCVKISIPNTSDSTVRTAQTYNPPSHRATRRGSLGCTRVPSWYHRALHALPRAANTAHAEIHTSHEQNHHVRGNQYSVQAERQLFLLGECIL